MPHTGNPLQQTPLTQMIHATTPQKQKLAAIRYLTNHLLNYPTKDSEKENDIMMQILYNNKY